MGRLILLLVLLLPVWAGVTAEIDPAGYTTDTIIAEEFYCMSEEDEDCLMPGVLTFPKGRFAARPLVLIAHGNGFEFDEYRYLAEHLAHNGFVVAGVASRLDSEISERVEDIFSHLRFLYDTHGNQLSDDLVLIGHSRGGEAVIRTANRLNHQLQGVQLRALVAMAPSLNDGVEALSAHAAQSFLLLYGSHDDDIVGEVEAGMPCDSPFRLYDRAFEDAGRAPQHALGSKAMAFMLGASHGGFSDRESIEPDPAVGINSYLEPGLQRHTTKRLVLSLLRWQVFGEAVFAPYLMEAQRSEGVVLQYEDGARLMLEDFEFATQEDPVLKPAWRRQGAVTLHWDRLYNLEAHSPHDSGGLMVKWNESVWSDARLTFELPKEFRDWEGFPYLSFRAAQVYGDINNRTGCDLDWEIVLESNPLSRAVRVSDFASLHYPETTVSAAIAGMRISKTAMQTVRIPLSAFGQVDWRGVKALSFRFTQPRANGFRRGSLVLDNLALTH
ncbi:serine aminopeptidase domain-containing protein [Acanthopleuribacter pedis]|uniref:Alpha/beta hydrolase n=1 Tax=Acanthopleuribacter pedis TaxID=442870 RepID=A0A8J7Q9P4_9BACT|nr:alpha/beta hydrolase [Acanthopleuribacter pedis]MBO1320490.1 alpha/beta hydrolase [Acanthopleuribacter pedis]